MEFAFFTAKIAYIFAECPVDSLIGALSNLQLSKRPSTPGTRFVFYLIHCQSPWIRPSKEVPSLSAISIAVYNCGI